MLLNQFKTTVTGLSSGVSISRAGSSALRADSFLVVRRASKCAAVRASSTPGEGWFESSIAGRVTSKVAKVADAALHYVDGRHGDETVQYNGTAVVLKKYNVDANLNIIFNADADIIDDKSDIEGKNITVQLVSSEIDPSMS